MTGTNIYKDNLTNIDVDEDSMVQIYCTNQHNEVKKPMVQLEIAWRYEP